MSEYLPQGSTPECTASRCWRLGNGDSLGISACPLPLAALLQTWFHLTPYLGAATLHLSLAAEPLPEPRMPHDLGGVYPAADGKSVQIHYPQCGFSLADSEASGTLWLSEAFWQSSPAVQREFFGLVLLWLLKRKGVFLHGSCVADAQGRGIVAVGASGSGKSTTAYALVREGLRSVSDDYVWLWPTPHGLQSLALQRGLHLDRRLAAYYPELAQAVAPATRGKDLFCLEFFQPQRGTPACTPQVLLFPSVTHAPQTQLQPLTPRASLLRLIAQCGAIALPDGYGGERLTQLQALTQQTCAYALYLGADTYGDSARLAALMLPLWEATPSA